MTEYSELVKALRDIEKTMFALGTSSIKMDNVSIRLAYDKKWGRTAKEAADAIEALQKGKAIANRKLDSVLKKAPKCGEWKRDEKRWGENSIRCSLCGAVIEDEEWGWRNWNYCYHCGAKMEVQE